MKTNNNALGRTIRRTVLSACSLIAFNAYAAIPSGYYDTVNASSSTSLRSSLHNIIDDHHKFPYSASTIDTWNILEVADQDPNSAGNVIDVYLNASYQKFGGGNNYYNREHTWPKSYGFPKDGPTNYAYTDTHHLFISNSTYNSHRSNKPFASCSSGCTEYVTQSNNGRGGSSSESNWTSGANWQTWEGRKGDVARALLYLDVRYEGGTHGITGVSEPDLILTDDRTLISNSQQGSNISVAYMGLRSVLLQWHKDDPVDAFETRHNDAVYLYQGNRNPFVDHPEYVACVFENNCSGVSSGAGGNLVAPASPTSVQAAAGASDVTVTWTANSESDLAGYSVYRTETSGSGYVKLNVGLVNSSSFTDNTAQAGTTYHYVITATDKYSNQSGYSAEASTSGGSAPTTEIWINELHYDNSGTDVNEFIEIAGTANTNLSGWSILAYNGSGGTVYKTIPLSGTLANQSNGFGVLSFAASGLQNGSPEGLALINNAGAVVQFISYEGAFTATDGAASGMKSVDIGVSENSSTQAGYSLQLTGSGSKYSDFAWQSAANDSPAQINSGQNFVASGGPVAQPTYFENTSVTAIPDASSIVSNISVSRTDSVSQMTVAVNITHTYRGDISLVLTSPSGANYTLKTKDGGDGGQNVIASYPVSFSGNPQGVWKLTVADNYSQDVGQLNNWSIQF
ncbi:endonuclease [Flocculibacter collagenilyticus]|uniref:endonuclease n=1 Tax=Flocculibacter collagenilyticus TaxID=2744479 RepID=UPI0018F433D0|nr:endonuclease [Flocculibacter collagenilyticus]